ncbi:hypothetical protein HMPREF1531_01418 [Propionibacterium sp. oral taxon 192 str. F0372]|nr:hypothetical protein HMPREF1531_01418 [Propionibacterium sp. oral taxon 192 str. F0372]
MASRLAGVRHTGQVCRVVGLCETVGITAPQTEQ